MNITPNESLVLNEIARHEMNPENGAVPISASEVSTYCWVDEFTGGVLSVNAVKGVVSSLVKKKLIVVSDWDDDDTVVSFTEEGFSVWKSFFDKGEFGNG
tara:strand:+ start:2348 stop:2647 length:300 start_codon:yes stop_codon:yes gene_type:complete